MIEVMLCSHKAGAKHSGKQYRKGDPLHVLKNMKTAPDLRGLRDVGREVQSGMLPRYVT